MTDQEKTEAANKINADQIKDHDATQHGPRGNVFSEAAEPAQHEAPPPLAH